MHNPKPLILSRIQWEGDLPLIAAPAACPRSTITWPLGGDEAMSCVQLVASTTSLSPTMTDLHALPQNSSSTPHSIAWPHQSAPASTLLCPPPPSGKLAPSDLSPAPSMRYALLLKRPSGPSPEQISLVIMATATRRLAGGTASELTQAALLSSESWRLD